MGFSGQTHMDMPISALNGTEVNRSGHSHVGLPRMVRDGSHITALLEKKYEFIRMYLFPTKFSLDI